MMLALPLPPYRGKLGVLKRDCVTASAIVISTGALLAYFLANPLFRRRSAWALILLGTSLLLLANQAWNAAFRHYVDTHTHKREVFRDTMRNFWSPMYGRYDNALARLDETSGTYSHRTLPFVFLSSAIALAWLWWARRAVARPWNARTFAALIAFQIAMMIAFALCEPWPTRFSNTISGYGEFSKDLAKFTGSADILRNYVARMESLQWYGRHYPPGNLILLSLESTTGPAGLTHGVVVLLTALSVIPLYKLAKDLDLSDSAAAMAVMLLAISTSVLVLPTINTTSMLLFPAMMCLWMFVRAMKTGSVAAGVILGCFYAMFLFFSFTASILGLLMVVTAAIGWRRGMFPVRNIITIGAISVGVVALMFVALCMMSGFNLVACFLEALRGHHAQQGSPFDDPLRYLLRSTGNILAYVFSTIPLCILAASAIRRSMPPAARALVVAVAVTILAAGFSGLFYVETERIWIFLTPALAIGAAFEVHRRGDGGEPEVPAFVVILTLLISCAQEFLFMHYR